MKKLLSVFLVTVLLSLMTTGILASETDATITVSSTEGYAGDEVSIKFSLNTEEAWSSLGFVVDYDESALTYKGISYGPVAEKNVFGKDNAFDPENMFVSVGMASPSVVYGEIMTLEFNINEDTENGSYTVSAKEVVMESGAYITEVSDGTVKVKLQSFEGIAFEGASYTYDGSEKELLISGTLPDGAEVSYENNKGTDAGIYEATATITAPGYEELELSAELEIKAKQLTIDGFGAEDKTYDGTTDATLVEGELVGVVGDDDVEAVYPEKGTFASKDASTKAISVSYDEIALTGEDAENYTLKAPGAIKAKITKAPITVKADDISIVLGQEIPALTYKITEGEVFTEGDLTGALATKANGNKAGTFEITKGTLKATDNYNFNFVNGTLTISEKLIQTITLAEIPALTYGDAAYTISVTKDATSNLEAFTYESDNTDVLTIADGVITVIGAGEATVTVTEPGNEEYAEAKASQKVTVAKKDVTITALDIEAKTATIEGIAGEDVLSVDFDKITLTKGEETEAETVDVTASNIILTGDKAANYNLTTENFVVSLAKDKIYTVAVTAENAEITGAGAYLAGSEVTLTVAPAKRYVFKGWYIGEELISEETSYTFTLNEDIALTALLEKKKTGGGTSSGSISLCRVEFDTDGGEAIYARKVEYGYTIGFVAAPVKEGYVFSGWFIDEEFETAYSEDMKITSDITLYAKWAKEGSIDDKADEKKAVILTIGEVAAKVFGEDKANDVAPVIRNDRTMLPARFVAEALGAEVSWNDEKREVTIEKGELKIVIVIDSDKAFIGEKEVALDSPAFIENDRTYTPIRFIAEALGASVTWDEETQKVTITVK